MGIRAGGVLGLECHLMVLTDKPGSMGMLMVVLLVVPQKNSCSVQYLLCSQGDCGDGHQQHFVAGVCVPSSRPSIREDSFDPNREPQNPCSQVL